MNKPLQFIFLPTDKAIETNSLYMIDGKLRVCQDVMNELMKYEDKIKPQYLYILSDEPQEGDWCIAKKKYGPMKYGNVFNEMIPAPHDCNRIIATTNPELNREKYLSEGMKSNDSFIPSISQSDIEYIISLYNGKDKEVDISQLAKDTFSTGIDDYGSARTCFVMGFKKCLELNADKKFTLEDMGNIMNLGMSLRQDQLNGHTSKSGDEALNDYIQSLTKEQSKSNTILVEYEAVPTEFDNPMSNPFGVDNEDSVYELKLDKNGNICIVR